MMQQRLFYRLTFTIIAVSSMIILCGCSFSINNQPRPRLGSYATSTPGTKFLGVENIGRHSYDISMFEGNGIVYTCRGGHIDITHLRIYADYTRYLYAYTLKQFRKNKTDLTFKLNVEPSSYYVKLTYPDGWTNLPKEQKESVAQEVALELGQYFTYTLATWHEILTFYGYKCMAVLPEEASAFSWEDIYSNLLGIQLGAKALADDDHGFNKAMTMLIKEEMENLGIQSSSVARNSAEKMRGEWFVGTLLVNMVRRNMDVGFDDGLVKPILVPGVCENVEPHSIPIPKLEAFYRHGFAMRFEVEPKEFEKDKILKIVYPNGGGTRIELSTYLPMIMDAVEKEAIRRGYVLVDPNNGKP